MSLLEIHINYISVSEKTTSPQDAPFSTKTENVYTRKPWSNLGTTTTVSR